MPLQSTTSPSFRSTAARRRELVVASALVVFARSGYLGTTIAAVAEHAGISPAYVSKLFPTKLGLFVAAVENCYDRIVDTLVAAADQVEGDTPSAILDAMGGAYAELIAERDLLMLQVHAQSAAENPEIAQALRDGLGRVVTVARTRSGATGPPVQTFIATGQLCHLIVTLDLNEQTGPWASDLVRGIRHPAPPEVGDST